MKQVAQESSGFSRDGSMKPKAFSGSTLVREPKKSLDSARANEPKFLAVLGREPQLSLAELSALFSDVQQISENLALFSAASFPDIARLGGSLKLAEKITTSPLEFLSSAPEGKITFALSDYSKKASKKSVELEALKLKKILARHGHSVRVVFGDGATLSTATSLHNGLSGKNPRKIELLKFNSDYFRVIGVQDIDAYRRRDRERPARDAKVGMLPPKLAQILINLCGSLPAGSHLLDPFCGTGVLLQEALLMGYSPIGSDLNPRMVEYSRKNLQWLKELNNVPFGSKAAFATKTSFPDDSNMLAEEHIGGYDRDMRGAVPVTTGDGDPVSSDNVFEASASASFGENTAGPVAKKLSSATTGPVELPADTVELAVGDATTFVWQKPIDAVATEAFLGSPMSKIPSEMVLKTEKSRCKDIILGFLKNLSPQIAKNTPVVVAIPAWLRENGDYSRLEILDLLPELGYNVSNQSREGLLYFREGQIVARDIIILRKK